MWKKIGAGLAKKTCYRVSLLVNGTIREESQDVEERVQGNQKEDISGGCFEISLLVIDTTREDSLDFV